MCPLGALAPTCAGTPSPEEGVEEIALRSWKRHRWGNICHVVLSWVESHLDVCYRAHTLLCTPLRDTMLMSHKTLQLTIDGNITWNVSLDLHM